MLRLRHSVLISRRNVTGLSLLVSMLRGEPVYFSVGRVYPGAKVYGVSTKLSAKTYRRSLTRLASATRCSKSFKSGMATSRAIYSRRLRSRDLWKDSPFQFKAEILRSPTDQY